MPQRCLSVEHVRATGGRRPMLKNGDGEMKTDPHTTNFNATQIRRLEAEFNASGQTDDTARRMRERLDELANREAREMLRGAPPLKNVTRVRGIMI